MSALAIMLTRRCNMTCAHCSVESGPKSGGKGPPLEALLETLRNAAEAGVGQVQLTGGEPMLREKTALEMLRTCRRLGMRTRMTSNGFWGRTSERARRTLAALRDAGLDGLTISYDRFHAAFQGPEPVVNIARAAADLDFRVDVNVTRLADDEEVEELVAPFATLPSVRLRFYDVQPVGAARHLPGARLRSEVEGFCNACGIPALTEDGRVTACNGPSYFSPPGSPLAIGSLEDAPLGELLRRHRDDPILETIRTEGPGGLRDALREIPGFESFPRDRYAGMCDLCHHVTSSPEAVAALRTALAAPEREAVRVARRRLIDGERDGRSLSRAYANAEGAAQTFLAIALGHEIDGDVAGRVLGRADLDWRARAEWLIAAGLARPVLARIEEPVLARWAPKLFGSLLERGAIVDEARELAQRVALERIASGLRDEGVEGVVVGGATHRAWTPNGEPPRRAVPTIEILCADRRVASVVLARTGQARGEAGTIRSVARVVPEPWGFPDDEVLAGAVPLADPALEGLRRLAPSDALVAALVRASAEGLHGGLPLAWDAGATLSRDAVDPERVAALVSSLAAPRAFWVPAAVLAHRMGVPIPAGILAGIPRDRRQRRLERVAARRLFRDRCGSPMAEWSFRWAWPALATGSTSELGRRIPAVAARAGRDLPAAWREIGAGGVAVALREAGRVVGTWRSDDR